MSQNYSFPCQDGTDPECLETLTEPLALVGLSDEQVMQIVKESRVDLTPANIDENNLTLSEDEKQELVDTGVVQRVEDFRLTICGPCGSDS